jgi:hypothetical protein
VKEVPVRVHPRNGVYDLVALVDDEDYARVSATTWYADFSPSGRVRRVRSLIDRKQTPLHRFVLNLKKGDPDVDHIDRNPLNNQKDNLRPTNPSLNGQNRHGKRVWLNPAKKMWHAKTSLDGVPYNLGYYDSEEEAELIVKNFRAMYAPASIEAREHSPTCRSIDEIEAEIDETARKMWERWAELCALRQRLKHVRRERTAHGRGYKKVSTPPMRVPVHSADD